MTAKPDSPTAFTLNDKILLRLTCIHKRVTTDVLKFAFENDTKDRPQNTSLLEYYKSKGISGFNRGLNKEQKRRINTDITGATFDITLLYTCLRNGSVHLAPKDDDKWTIKDGSSIESLIGIVKDKRNNMAHEELSFTNKQLLDETQELKEALIKIIRYCGQLYSLSDTVIDSKIEEVEQNVKKYLYDDFDPKTIEEYKEELIFDALTDKINSDGVKDLQEQYIKQCEDRVSTVTHLVDICLPLDHIYTEMKLNKRSVSDQLELVPFEDIFLDSGQNKTDSIVVISGVAGVGKTTFTKKILYDWLYGKSDMKHLTDHDILLKTECRNTAVKCFDYLLVSLMPRVSREFKSSDLRKIVLAQNVLVMVDGLDELNKNSADLFEEMLYLKKSHQISILITTRPEKLKYLEDKIKVHKLNMKHIELVGVPMEKRSELVTKYHNEIAKTKQGIRDIGGLLSYLDKTMYRLADLWKLPYNLTLITLLWVYDFMNVAAINTAPELYREILRLCKNKLMERLRSGETTHHLPESMLRRDVDIFLKCLAKESLIGLKDNHINLQHEAYERLKAVCDYIKISVEELTSAFLKRLPGVEDNYSFPHKGLQDYLAALYIWMEITKKGETTKTQKIMDDITTVLHHNNVDFEVAQNVLSFTKQQLEAHPSSAGFLSRVKNMVHSHLRSSSIIRNIMYEIHGSSDYDISKFQNMFMCVIGLFYLENDTVHWQTKLETMRLLQRTGVHNKEHWITVLNSVKCDDFVASFISRQPRVLDGYVEITDSSASAYVSLMQALKPPLKHAHFVKVNIDIKGDLDDSAQRLFQLINLHQFGVKSIRVTDKNLRTYFKVLEELKIPFVDASSIKAEVIVDEVLHDVMKFLKLIEGKGISIKALKARDIDINDSNFQDVINTMKNLPRIPKDANLTRINLDMEGDLFDVDELRRLIVRRYHRIKRFLVTEHNYEKYIQILKSCMVHLNHSNDVEMKIVIDKDIICLTEFLREIKERDLIVKMFKVRAFRLTDENADEYHAALRMMSPKCQEANTTVVDVQLINHRELEIIVQLIAELGFKVMVISIRPENVGVYTDIFKRLNPPLKDAHELVVDIDVNSDLSDIHELLREINNNKFQIGKLKFNSDQMHIDDNNANGSANAIALLPTSVRANLKVKLDFREKSPIIEIIMTLLAELAFKEKIISIRDENARFYTTIFSNLKLLLKDVEKVVVDINVKSLPDIQYLLWEIKDTKFRIGKLNFDSGNLIHDDIAQEYASVLQLLPAFVNNDNIVALSFTYETPYIGMLLKEISKHRFTVRIHLSFGIYQPMSYSYLTVESLKMVFEKCRVTFYSGLISPELMIPPSVESLQAGIPDNEAYIRLKTYLGYENRMELIGLHINMSLTVNIKDIVPLPGDLRYSPRLTFAEIILNSDIYKASEIAKRLAPASGKWKGTYMNLTIFGLGCLLETVEIVRFLKALKGLTVLYDITFPVVCQPKRSDEDSLIQNLSKDILGCKNGIKWD